MMMEIRSMVMGVAAPAPHNTGVETVLFRKENSVMIAITSEMMDAVLHARNSIVGMVLLKVMRHVMMVTIMMEMGVTLCAIPNLLEVALAETE